MRYSERQSKRDKKKNRAKSGQQKKRSGIGARTIQRRHAAWPQKKKPSLKPTPRPCMAPALALAPGRGSKAMGIPIDANLRASLQNLWMGGPPPRQHGAVKKLTVTQEGNRRPHGAASLLDGQRPQLDEERGINLGPL